LSSKSKRKGKDGEVGALLFLKSNGWYIANREVQGLAGDDIFARDPDEKWWSIEVKNTIAYHPKFMKQARKQAQERWGQIQSKIATDPIDGEVMCLLKMDEFRPNNWLVMWHPSNNDCRSAHWVAIKRETNERDNRFSEFIAPWGGTFE
jgi:Holliday junction resolvase-like predicted endonuclease